MAAVAWRRASKPLRSRDRHGGILDQRLPGRPDDRDRPGGRRWRTVDLQVVAGLLHPAQGEAEAHLDHLAGLGGPTPHQAERAQRGGPDPVEVQARAAVHQPPVVPQQLPPVARVALDMGGERGSLHHGLGLRHSGAEGLQVRPQRDRRAVGDGQPAHREVDDEPGVAVRREGVAVHRGSRAHGQLAADARAEGAGVVAGLGPLVGQLPGLAQTVQRLEHRGDPEVVVVLPDRAGPRLLEVGEARGDLPVVQLDRDTLGIELIAAVAGRVRAGVGAGRHHAEREGRARMGIPHLRLGPPPGLGQPVRDRQVGGRTPDEGVDVFEHEHPPEHQRRLGDRRSRAFQLCFSRGGRAF